MNANASILLAEQVLGMDLGTPKGLHAKALARDVLKQQDYMLQTLRLIAHATKPEPDDGGGHENAYELATQCISAVESPQEGSAAAALSTPPPEARETAEPIGFITEEALRLLRDPEWLAQRGTYANLWGTDGPPNRAIVPVFAAPVSQPEALPLKSMNWHPGPIKTEWGDGMLVADVELSPDQTLTMFIHKNALPLLKDKP